MKKFYVYKIFHEIEKKYYVGSRTISNKIDILNGYNTSSKVVHNLIDEYGIEKFKLIEVIELTSAKKAIEKEDEILKSIKNKEDYLNINFSAGGSIIKSQTHIQIYNIETDEYMYHPKKVKIPQGWIKKSSFKPPSRKGFRTIINTLNHKTKIINTLAEIIPDGWEIKTEYDKKIHNSIEKRTECITDGLQNKKIRKSDKLPDGWRFGRTKKRNSDVYINDGTYEKLVSPNEKIPINYKIGRISIKRTYIYNGKYFELKKDLIKYLNMTITEFDYKLAKNRIENIEVYDNNILVNVDDRYYREKVNKENDKRGKSHKCEYIYDGIIFKGKKKLLEHLDISEKEYNYKIKNKYLIVERRLKNNGYKN